jgi:hypothetical protein
MGDRMCQIADTGQAEWPILASGKVQSSFPGGGQKACPAAYHT